MNGRNSMKTLVCINKNVWFWSCTQQNTPRGMTNSSLLATWQLGLDATVRGNPPNQRWWPWKEKQNDPCANRTMPEFCSKQQKMPRIHTPTPLLCYLFPIPLWFHFNPLEATEKNPCLSGGGSAQLSMRKKIRDLAAWIQHRMGPSRRNPCAPPKLYPKWTTPDTSQKKC